MFPPGSNHGNENSFQRNTKGGGVGERKSEATSKSSK